MSAALFWFRRDLRLRDNPALSAAVSSSAPVHAVYCVRENERLNLRQRAFVAAALRNLAASLAKTDATLSFLQGDAAEGLLAAAHRLGAARIFATRALDPRERQTQEAVRIALASSRIELRTLSCPTLHDPDEIAQRKQAPGAGYRVFPPFYAAWKALAVERPLAVCTPSGRDPSPGSIENGALIPGTPQASELAAQEALARFVTARGADYGINSEYPARDATSGLAAYLRFGLLSSKAVFWAVSEKMARSWTLAQERLSMQSFLRRLALRDFFMHLAHHAPEVFEEALQTKMRGFAWSHDEKREQAWLAGKTGYPLVDAAMRELHATGHVHQHAAVVAASFCAADLGLDWRFGKNVWMKELLEADEALCAGNWQRIAGIGSDQAAYPRIYNPARQAQLFDPGGAYVRRWCPELAKLPTAVALAPWAVSESQQTELGFFVPDQYPRPIVDHERAAKEFLSKYQAYRNRT